MKEEYSEHLANAKDEANEILKIANKKATVRGEEIIRDAQEKAAAIVARADVQIEMERKRAFEEVKQDISDIALLAASKVVERELSAEEHERLIGEFIENVGEC
jgi:F-type H+-transporting ATPase subunit b